MNLPEIEKIIQLFNKMSDMDIAILDADYRNLVHGQSDSALISISLLNVLNAVSARILKI